MAYLVQAIKLNPYWAPGLKLSMDECSSGNASSATGSSSGFALTDSDVDKIVKALGGRLVPVNTPVLACSIACRQAGYSSIGSSCQSNYDPLSLHAKVMYRMHDPGIPYPWEQQLRDEDVLLWQCRLRHSTSFHIFEFILGLIIAAGFLTYYLYWSKRRYSARNQQKDAIEVFFPSLHTLFLRINTNGKSSSCIASLKSKYWPRS